MHTANVFGNAVVVALEMALVGLVLSPAGLIVDTGAADKVGTVGRAVDVVGIDTVEVVDVVHRH